MRYRTPRWTPAIGALAAVVALSPSAGAQRTFPVSYSLTYAPGPPPVLVGTTLQLTGSATGSLTTPDPLLDALVNPVAWNDQAGADVTTGLLNGSFVMTLANGDQLFGDLFENVSQLIATGGIGSFPQRVTIRSGTGLFVGASGVLSGNGVGTATGSTASGTGTLTLAPEPTSVALLGGGLLALWGVRRRIART